MQNAAEWGDGYSLSLSRLAKTSFLNFSRRFLFARQIFINFTQKFTNLNFYGLLRRVPRLAMTSWGQIYTFLLVTVGVGQIRNNDKFATLCTRKIRKFKPFFRQIHKFHSNFHSKFHKFFSNSHPTRFQNLKNFEKFNTRSSYEPQIQGHFQSAI